MLNRLKSFKYAFQGMGTLLKEEPNARIHLLATLVVICLGFYFNVSLYEWFALILCIALVWITEALNTALENLCDKVNPDFHPVIKKVKDVAAFAVLAAAICAVTLGLMIFIPYLQAI